MAAHTEYAPPPRRRWRSLVSRGTGVRSGDPEPAGALVCAILGLFIPILSAVGLACSKEGTPARILSIVGLVLWVMWIIYISVARPVWIIWLF
jgi:hypothetical protein